MTISSRMNLFFLRYKKQAGVVDREIVEVYVCGIALYMGEGRVNRWAFLLVVAGPNDGFSHQSSVDL